MKGLILSGGKGTRMRPLTFTRAKQLIPIANKPNLFYGIEDVVGAGVSEIGIIISPDTGDEVKAAAGDGRRWGVRITYIMQHEPRGLAHAVLTARDFLGDDAFVMYLGDNILSGGIGHLVEEYQRGGAAAIVLLTPVPNPQQFGVAELNESGQVVRLVEKPKEPKSDLALVGVYLFGPQIHGIIDGLEPSWRGEYEITDAIQGLLDSGQGVIAHQVRGWWKDTGRPEDLLDANRLVLSHIAADLQGEIVDSQVTGEVVIEPGARINRSTVRGPAHIAADAVIEDSYVGPYTSIGRGTAVHGSEVEYSIVLDGSEIRDLPTLLDASVIGQEVQLVGPGSAKRRKALTVALGDGSRVQL